MESSTAHAIYDEYSKAYYEEKEKDSKYIDPEIMEWVKSGWNNPRKINLPESIINKKHNLNIRNNLPRKFKLQIL